MCTALQLYHSSRCRCQFVFSFFSNIYLFTIRRIAHHDCNVSSERGWPKDLSVCLLACLFVWLCLPSNQFNSIVVVVLWSKTQQQSHQNQYHPPPQTLFTCSIPPSISPPLSLHSCVFMLLFVVVVSFIYACISYYIIKLVLALIDGTECVCVFKSSESSPPPQLDYCA